MKICVRCNLMKDLLEFGPDKRKKDGREHACRECERTRKRESARKPECILRKQNYRKNHREQDRRCNRAYQLAHPEETRIRQNRYRKLNPEKRRVWEATYKARHVEKLRAKYKIKHAKEKGKIIQRPCEVCGKIKSEAHHPNYSKPLEVVWLCKQHHEDAHHKNLQLT